MTIREAQSALDIRGMTQIWLDSRTREVYFCDKKDLPPTLIPAIVFIELSERELLRLDDN